MDDAKASACKNILTLALTKIHLAPLDSEAQRHGGPMHACAVSCECENSQSIPVAGLRAAQRRMAEVVISEIKELRTALRNYVDSAASVFIGTMILFLAENCPFVSERCRRVRHPA